MSPCRFIPRGVIVDAPVSNMDIASTILEVAGTGDEFLRREGRIIDGRSLLPMVAPLHAAYSPGCEVRSRSRSRPLTPSLCPVRF